MNANLAEAREKNLTMTKIVGTCAQVEVEFQSKVVANFARRSALFTMSKIHQLHTISTNFSHAGGENYLDLCNKMLAELRSELNGLSGKIEDVRRTVPGLGQATRESFLISVPPQMELVRCYVALDAYAEKASGLLKIGKVRGAEMNALVCEAKQPFRRMVGLMSESIEEARNRYGASRVGSANLKATTMIYVPA